jgi:hypothetical protein
MILRILFAAVSFGLFLVVTLSCQWGQSGYHIVRLSTRDVYQSDNTTSTYETSLRQTMDVIRKKNLRNSKARFDLFLHESNELVSIHVQSGALFTTDQQHILIRTETLSGKFYDLFVHHAAGYRPVVHQEISRFASVSDTIADVNNDGHPDFLLHRRVAEHGADGVYDIYLQDNNTGNFLPRRESGSMTLRKNNRRPEYFHSGEAWNM